MTACELAHIGPSKVLESSLTFSTPPNAASYPHAGIQMQVPGIPGLHVYVKPEAVSLGVHLIRLRRVI